MGSMTHRLCALALGIAALALGTLTAAAQSWPSRPVKFILPLGAGSGADIGARLFAERLSAKWGQPVVVENRPGGDGFVAITAFTSAKDDHVFLWGPAAAFTAHPYLHEKLPYDPNEISPVARITTTIVSMSVPTGLNINSMKDLIARAKAEPGQLTWATVTGATDFVFAGWLKMDGLDMLKVPYRDPVTALNDLSENRIQVFTTRPDTIHGVTFMVLAPEHPLIDRITKPTLAGRSARRRMYHLNHELPYEMSVVTECPSVRSRRWSASLMP